jgi:short-subunit dehydrogenase
VRYSDWMSHENKTIVITGASEGIGAQLALELAQPGVKLVLAARRQEALEKIAQSCIAKGARAAVVPTDVSSEAQCRALIVRTIEEFGSLDVLVNNAGVSMHAKFEEITDLSTFERVMQLNFYGPMWLTHAALPELRRARGLIVGVSSLAGKTGVPGRTVYCASKFALSGFYEALRIELADSGVDITMVFPGVVDTEIRRNGLNAAGQRAGVSGLKEQGAMSVEQCAREIVQAMQSRQREHIMTAKGRFGMKLKAFAPGLVDKMARNALKDTPS